MAPRAKVLFIVTSHDKLGNTDRKTGWYLVEGAHPYEALSPYADILWASLKGGITPLDPRSADVEEDDYRTQAFLKKKAIWESFEKISSFHGRADEFDAVFFVGGWGPMFDLAMNRDSHQLINEFYAANKILSAVCHGPVAFSRVILPSGKNILEGEPVTGYTDAEEELAGVLKIMPYSLENSLMKASGGNYTRAAEPLGVHVVVGRGGLLVNGQNPASAGPTAEAALAALRKFGKA